MFGVSYVIFILIEWRVVEEKIEEEEEEDIG